MLLYAYSPKKTRGHFLGNWFISPGVRNWFTTPDVRCQQQSAGPQQSLSGNIVRRSLRPLVSEDSALPGDQGRRPLPGPGQLAWPLDGTEMIGIGRLGEDLERPIRDGHSLSAAIHAPLIVDHLAEPPPINHSFTRSFSALAGRLNARTVRLRNSIPSMTAQG